MGILYNAFGFLVHGLIAFAFGFTGTWCIMNEVSYADFLQNNAIKGKSPLANGSVLMKTEFRHVGLFYIIPVILEVLAFMQYFCGILPAW